MVTDSMLAQAAAELNFAMLCSLPNTAECSHTFSADFEKKMRRILRRGNHPVLYRYAQRAATVLLVFLLGFMALVTVSPTVRASVFGWVRQQYESFTQYYFDGPESVDFVSAEYELTYIPEGYIEYYKDQMQGGTTIYYVNTDENQIIYFLYSENNEYIVYYLKYEIYELETTNVKGDLAEFYQSKNHNIANAILWQNSDTNTFFGISAFADKMELIKIAESVKKIKN